MIGALVAGLLGALAGLVGALALIAWLARKSSSRADQVIARTDEKTNLVARIAELSELYTANTAQLKETSSEFTDYRIRAEAQKKALHAEIDKLEDDVRQLYSEVPGGAPSRIAGRLRRLRERATDRNREGGKGPDALPDDGAGPRGADPQ